MRNVAADLAPAAKKPFFWGQWADTAGVSGGWVNLPITVVKYAQGGMILSGGGCKVPIAGLYHITVQCRTDGGAAGASYTHIQVLINGATYGYSISNNGNVSSYLYPYNDHQLWFPQPLKAGDVITCSNFYNTQAGTIFGAWGGNGGLRVVYDSPWVGTP